MNPGENALEDRFKADLIDGIGADDRDGTGLRIDGEVHANVHHSAEVRDIDGGGVDDRDIVVDEVPTGNPAGEGSVGAADELGPVTVIIVKPAAIGLALHNEADTGRKVGGGDIGADERKKIGTGIGRRVQASVWADRHIDNACGWEVAQTSKAGGEDGGAITAFENGDVNFGAVRGESHGFGAIALNIDGLQDDSLVDISNHDAIYAGAGDEGAVAYKDDIFRTVFGIDEADDIAAGDVDDVDGIGDMVDDPDLVCSSESDSDRIDADGNRLEEEEGVAGNVEQFDSAVGEVTYGEESVIGT